MALPIACPAASEVNPPQGASSVICGVLELSNDGAHAHGFQSRGQVTALISGDRDARQVAFCCGDGCKRVGYTTCEIWRAQREAEWAARRGPDALRDERADRAPQIDADLLAEAMAGD